MVFGQRKVSIFSLTTFPLDKEYGTITRQLREAALCDADGWCPATDADGSPIYKDNQHRRAGERALG